MGNSLILSGSADLCVGLSAFFACATFNTSPLYVALLAQLFGEDKSLANPVDTPQGAYLWAGCGSNSSNW